MLAQARWCCRSVNGLGFYPVPFRLMKRELQAASGRSLPGAHCSDRPLEPSARWRNGGEKRSAAEARGLFCQSLLIPATILAANDS